MAEIVAGEKLIWSRKIRKKKIVLIAVIAVLLLGAALFAYQKLGAKRNNLPSMQIVTVQRGDVTETVSATGTVRASVSVELDFSGSGSETLTSVNVKPGDRVKAGQVLATLDDSDAKTQVSIAEANLLAAQAQLAELQRGPTAEEIAIQEANVKKALVDLNEAKSTLKVQQAQEEQEKAKRELEKSRADYEKQKYLYDAGAISLDELEQAKQELDQAEFNYESAVLQYQQTIADSQKTLEEAEIAYQTAVAQLNQLKAPPKESELQQAKANVRQAEAQLQQKKLALHRLQLTAPMDGVILQVNGEVGEKPSSPFIVMDNSDSPNLEVLANVSQSDIGKIKAGMRAVITTSTYADKQFEGKVTRIYPEPVAESGVTQYQVLLEVENKERLLMTGMNVDVTIETGTHKNVLYIPASALRSRGGADGVFVLSDSADKGGGREGGSVPYRFQPIEVGYYTPERVEVVSGLKEGDKIVIPFQNASSNSGSGFNNRGGGFPGGGFPGGGIPGGGTRIRGG